ncbi:MAG: hypothetical protein WA970_22170 [Gammaproteobacteria bacterium]|jgi:hypothetical protein
MAGAEGTDLGLADIYEDEDSKPLDFSGFEPGSKPKKKNPPKEQIRAAAFEAGFQDREGNSNRNPPLQRSRRMKDTSPAIPKTNIRRSLYYRTGRSQQINLKGQLSDKERLGKLCDDQNWVQGQAFQYALDALEEKIAAGNADPFWSSRSFKGVD